MKDVSKVLMTGVFFCFVYRIICLFFVHPHSLQCQSLPKSKKVL